jgi:hypothetical protein
VNSVRLFPPNPGKALGLGAWLLVCGALPVHAGDCPELLQHSFKRPHSTVTPDDPRILHELQVMLDAPVETVGGSGRSAGDPQSASGNAGEQRG